MNTLSLNHWKIVIEEGRYFFENTSADYERKKDISPCHIVVKVDYEKHLNKWEYLRSKSRVISQIVKDFKRSVIIYCY